MPPSNGTSTRLHLLCGAIALSALGLLSDGARAQSSYPNRPITLIVPFAAGGSTDTIARPLALEMARELSGSVVVENRGGAGGSIAVDATVRAEPDGYTLLLGSIGPLTVTQFLLKHWKTDPGAQLEPIGLIADAPAVVVVPLKLGVNTLQELIERARREPDRLTYASASVGSSNHLGAVLLERATGIKTRHVPYRGAAPALGDVVAGHIDYMVAAVPSARGQIEGGQLKALAIAGASRSPLMPHVPTAHEAGVADYRVTTWYGLCAPRGLPKDVLARISAAFESAMKTSQMLGAIRSEGAEPATLRGADFARFMGAERKRWGDLIRDAKIGE